MRYLKKMMKVKYLLGLFNMLSISVLLSRVQTISLSSVTKFYYSSLSHMKGKKFLLQEPLKQRQITCSEVVDFSEFRWIIFVKKNQISFHYKYSNGRSSSLWNKRSSFWGVPFVLLWRCYIRFPFSQSQFLRPPSNLFSTSYLQKYWLQL